MFDNFDFASSPAVTPSQPVTTEVTLLMTSDDGKNKLVFAESSEDWRTFIPEGFETLTRLRKDYGCGLSVHSFRELMELANVPHRELYILTPATSEHRAVRTPSTPATSDNEFRLLTTHRGKLSYDSFNECVYLNGSRFTGLNPYVVTVYDKAMALDFLTYDFLPHVDEVRPYMFRHPKFRSVERGGRLTLDPAKVFKTFRVDVAKRGIV